MACPEIVIDQIPNELYSKLLAEATAAGAQFSGSTATFKGCEFDWNYDTEAAVLHVTCTKKPFYFSCDLIESQIRGIADKAKAGI